MKNKSITFSAFVLICIPLALKAQDSTRTITLSGYVDVYGSYYTDSLAAGAFQQFPSTDPRSAQPGLNIAQLSLDYSSPRVRSTVTLHYGDLPLAAWSPDFTFVEEAHAGVRLCKHAWLDGGFFRTHIGGEGLDAKENIASSIALPTYFEPYYEAGFRLNYLPTAKWNISFYLLNGYNIFADNNNKKSAGIYINYALSDHVNITYSDYVGDDTDPDADSVQHLRFYNNLLFTYEKDHIRLLAQVDYAVQQNSALDNPLQSATMISGLLAIRYAICNAFGIYVRGETFQDPEGFLSGIYFDDLGELSGLHISGATLGLEYKPTDNSYVRLEGRELVADTDMFLFYWNGNISNSRFEGLLNVGVWFE